MKTPDRDAAVCRNEGCSRRADPGEEYCSACRLEACLFHRELRWSGKDASREEVPGRAAIESSPR